MVRPDATIARCLVFVLRPSGPAGRAVVDGSPRPARLALLHLPPAAAGAGGGGAGSGEQRSHANPH
ncbi:hypothetical protein [Falsiroseomonas frigidaquae]|uniref:hypothetical protein n=1 Tax=Falsiroseomonas frigidaquae TaxID=487318 RepID=UPI0015C56CE1|nr:hypothetical protein [Falsiroseomonas frigidaquae]